MYFQKLPKIENYNEKKNIQYNKILTRRLAC